ncbi:MAG TPA: DUF3224 domain-containing protein [Rhodocyclaceae bacterium]|nr:DUF3224 domain-containing protein [Rhodocyclaceae bacterium]
MCTQQSSRAVARINVLNSEATPYDVGDSSALIEITLTERFAGDMDGTSTVRALQVKHRDGSASMVSLQRFVGRLGDRQGTFVLQGAESIEDEKIRATWFVVPKSGTDGLTGLRGEGGFEGEFGKGSLGSLDYWFE